MITIALLLLLNQAPQTPAQTAPVSTAQDDYLIGVADVINVTVFGEPDASRSSPKAYLPCARKSMRRPATPTVTPDSSSGASDDQPSTSAAASWVRSKR